MKPWRRSRRASAEPRRSRSCTCNFIRSPAIPARKCSYLRMCRLIPGGTRHRKAGQTRGAEPWSDPWLEQGVHVAEDRGDGVVREDVVDRLGEDVRDRQNGNAFRLREATDRN